MIYFLAYLFLEVMITSYFTTIFGGFVFFIEIIISAIVGALLLKNFQYNVAENLYSVYKKEMSISDIAASSFFSVVGAILLIVPGIFTDIVGILMQFDFVGIFIKELAIKKGYFATYSDTSNNKKRRKKDEVIDVEVIESSDTISTHK